MSAGVRMVRSVLVCQNLPMDEAVISIAEESIPDGGLLWFT